MKGLSEGRPAGFSSAVATALELARTKDADYLPDWCGPTGGAAARSREMSIRKTLRKLVVLFGL